MADEFVRLVKIGIDQSFVKENIASADRLAESIDELNKVKKEEGKLTSEQEGRLKALKAERNKNLQVIKQANLLTSEQIKGQEKLKAQLSVLTAQYNKLTTEEQKNTDEGKRLQKQILDITEELKANEKAVGNNRRNVGNYEGALKGLAGQVNVLGVNIGNLVGQLETFKQGAVASGAAMKASATSTGLLSGALNILKIALISTGIGAIVVALGTMVTFLTQTKRGSEQLSQALAAVGAAISVVVDRISAVGEAVLNVFTGKGSVADLVNTTKDAFTGLTDEIVRETKEAAALEKRMQSLTDAERALNVERSKSRAEIKELNKIAEDTSKTLKEREDAAMRAIEIEKNLMDEQVRLAQERFDIIKAQNEQGESSADDLDRQAEAEIRLGDIKRESLELQTTLQNKLNVIRQQDSAARKKAADEEKKLSEEEKKAQEKAEADLIKGFEKERAMIDELAQIKIDQATANIANEEERAKAIAYIEEQALRDKIANIDDETVAYTAAANAIGGVDEEKYAKQLAERAKYEAQIAAMDRAAKAEAFNREIELLNGREQLEIEAAELSIDNENHLQTEKHKIALKYAQQRLALMEKEALLDKVLTEKELQNLQRVENVIKRIQQDLDNPDAVSVSQSLGLSEDQINQMQLGLDVIAQTIQSVQQATQAAAENRIQEIDQRTQAEVAAVEKSTLSEEKKKEKVAAIEKKAAKERYKIELQQFKTAKALQIALAVANTATAVMAQMSNPTPYVGIVLAALAAATGAVQIGIIASQKPPPPPAFASGGYVSGPGSATSDSIPAMLSNGESVNNARATAKYGHIFSALNASEGGVDWYRGEGFSKGGLVRKFAAGGIARSSETIMRENEAAASINRTILQTPPVLVLEEFQDVQGRQVRTEQNLQL